MAHFVHGDCPDDAVGGDAGCAGGGGVGAWFGCEAVPVGWCVRERREYDCERGWDVYTVVAPAMMPAARKKDFMLR